MFYHFDKVTSVELSNNVWQNYKKKMILMINAIIKEI